MAHYWRVVIEQRAEGWYVDAEPALYGYRHGKDEAVALGPFQTERGAGLVATAVVHDLQRASHRLRERKPAKSGFTYNSLRANLQRLAQTHGQVEGAVRTARHDVFHAATPEVESEAAERLRAARAALSDHPEERARLGRAASARDAAFYFRTL